jgi:topoisomerase-4 subunit A
MLVDVRDESAEDIRLILEPKSRNVEPVVLIESLFRQTELETRFGLNMNVLDANQTPRVMSLREVLQAFLDHRHDVLVRRSKFRLNKIADRLEVLHGYMIVYVNLDEVIRIIREEDDAKKVLKKKWNLTDGQVDAILNMRLRALRRLEEIAIQEEIGDLEGEQKSLSGLLKDRKKRLAQLADKIGEIRKKFGAKTDLGRRRTTINDAPERVIVPVEAIIEREQVTVVCSLKGWVRTIKGHNVDESMLKYKEGDAGRFIVTAETTDKLVVFATNGRFYTVGVDKLPGGRGNGEPLSLMIDLGNDADIVQILVHQPSRKLFVASGDGRGFIVPEVDVAAQTRTGKQVLSVSGDVEAQACTVADGDHAAVIGDNRKLLIFPLSELPEMSRGRGVKLQNYKDGGLRDAMIFTLKDGLTVRTGGRHRTFEKAELTDWIGKRSQAGRLPPQGFPRSNTFS